MWQIYFQSNLNLFSVGNSAQTLIKVIIICILLFCFVGYDLNEILCQILVYAQCFWS